MGPPPLDTTVYVTVSIVYFIFVGVVSFLAALFLVGIFEPLARWLSHGSFWKAVAICLILPFLGSAVAVAIYALITPPLGPANYGPGAGTGGVAAGLIVLLSLSSFSLLLLAARWWPHSTVVVTTIFASFAWFVANIEMWGAFGLVNFCAERLFLSSIEVQSLARYQYTDAHAFFGGVTYAAVGLTTTYVYWRWRVRRTFKQPVESTERSSKPDAHGTN